MGMEELEKNLEEKVEKKEVKLSPEQSLKKLIISQKQQIAMALPKHVTADRMLRIALTEISKNPKLLECSPNSFLGAIIQASQLGLEVGNMLGHAYLIPFKSSVSLMIGYKGMLDLARRSGTIVSLSTRIVYANDSFKLKYGINETLDHIPTDEDEKGVMTHVYAIAHLKGGGYQFEVMSKKDIDKIKNKHSRGGDIWTNHYEEMAKKTVIRRLFKYLPVSIELQKAVSLDEMQENNLNQVNETILLNPSVSMDDLEDINQ